MAGNAGVGGSLSANVITGTTKARVHNTRLDTTGLLTIEALSNSTIRALSVAVGLSQSASVHGSLSTSVIVTTTEAVMSKDPEQQFTSTVGLLTVSAEDRSKIEAIAGSAGASSKAAVDGAVAVNTIVSTTKAHIAGANLRVTGGPTKVEATNASIIHTVAVGGQVASSAAVGGSETTSVIRNVTEADVSDSQLDLGGGNIGIAATDRSEIDVLSGEAAGSGNAAVGAAVSVNVTANATKARLHNSTVDTTGLLDVRASNSSIIRAISVALGAGSNAAVEGSLTTSVIANTTEALISNAPADNSAGSVSVVAEDKSKIEAVAGSAGLSGRAAVGGAVAVNVIANTTAARILASNLNVSGTTNVHALSESTARTLTAGGQVSVNASVEGSVATSNVDNTTEAVIENSVLSNEANSVAVVAEDKAQIVTLSGEAAVAVIGAGVGAAVSVNRTANKTKAHVSGSPVGKSHTVGNLLVMSASETTIISLAVGANAAFFKGAGVAGSTAVNLINNETSSYIDSGAKILARNNVGVIAESHDIVTNAGGTVALGLIGVGLGASVSVIEIGGSTKAYIHGSDTDVTALAEDPDRTLTVAAGGLKDDVDLGRGVDMDHLASFQPVDLKALRRTEEATGVVVNASSTHRVENAVGNAGLGLFAGIGGNTTTSVIAGSTEAYVDQAKINASSRDQAGSAQSISVKASDIAYSHGFSGSVGGGVFAGIGASVDTNVFARNTSARLASTSDVYAKKATVVHAQSTHGSSSLAVSGAGALGGFAGSVSVNVYTGLTEAYVLSAVVNTGSLTVSSEHETRLFVASGGLGLGVGGWGGGFFVGVDHTTTKAFIRDSIVETTGEIGVAAESSSEVRPWAIGAASGGAAQTWSVPVTVVGNTTMAYVEGSQLGRADRRANNVSVEALDRVIVESRAGTIAYAGAALAEGYTASVTSVNNTTSAFIHNSSVYTAGDTNVGARSERDLSSIAASLTAGILGYNGAIAVTVIASALSGDLDELNYGDRETPEDLDGHSEALTDALGQTNFLSDDGRMTAGENVDIGGTIEVDDGNGGRTLTAGLTSADIARMNNAGKVSVTGSLNPSALESRTTALVTGNSVINAVGDVRISADEDTRVRIDTGMAAGALFAAIGGSVGVGVASANVHAQVAGGSTIVSDQGKIEIAAGTGRLLGSDPALSVNAYQAGLATAQVSAAVSVANVTNNVTAEVGRGATLTANDATAADDEERLTVKAIDATDVEATAHGASISGGALGAVVAVATRNGLTRALVSDDAASGSITRLNLASGLLSVKGERAGRVAAQSRAGAAGLLWAGDASVAVANEDGEVSAAVGNGVTIEGEGRPVKVEAVSEPQVDAEALGYGGSILRVGVSVAVASASTDAKASIGAGGSIKARSLDVNAIARPSGSGFSAKSFAEAAGGGVVGVNATVSTAQTESTVTALVGASTLTISGNVTVLAANSMRQEAEVSGVVGGAVAAGANIATAQANSTTTAATADGVSGTVGDTLSVDAVGSDDTHASAKSGSGGVVSGAASQATTNSVSNTRAELGAGSASSWLTVGKTALRAQHTTLFNGWADSLNAAVLGHSGATVTNNVTSAVNAVIRGSAKLLTSDLEVLAKNTVRKPWLADGVFNVRGGSGGVLNEWSPSRVSNISVQTGVGIGGAADVRVEGEGGSGRTDFTAINDIEARDKVKLDAGGVIQVPRTVSQILVNASTAEVNVGTGAKLESVGDINMGARTRADIETSANTKTYGVAGAAEGISKSSIKSDNSVDIGQSATITAGGDISLYAGRDAQGQLNSFNAVARTDLFNKTAFAITLPPKADASIEQTNLIRTGAGSSLISIGDISLHTNKGSQTAIGQGTGKDLAQEVLEGIIDAFSDIFGQGDVSLDVKGGTSKVTASSGVIVDGLVHAGLHNKQRLVVEADGTVSEITDGVTYTITEEDLVNNMFTRLSMLYELRNAYAGNSSVAAAYQSEINFILNELLELGYARQVDGTILPIANVPVRFINIGSVQARGGDINVTADYLAGSGTLRAPYDTEISITNKSAMFLRVSDLTIEDRGGRVYLNRSVVSNSGDVNSRNRPGSPLANLAIDGQGSSGTAPSIIVRNTLAYPGVGAPAPDIEVVGDIDNFTGSVTISSAKGSVKLLGQSGNAPTIIAATLNLSAGRDIVQSYVDDFLHIGGDPRQLWKDVQDDSESNRADGWYWLESEKPARHGTGSLISANNIYISARYLNINGTIQSGIPDWNMSIDGNAGDYYFSEWVENPEWVARGRPEEWSFIDELLYGPKYQLVEHWGDLNEWLEWAHDDWESQGRPSMSDPSNLEAYRLYGGGISGNVKTWYNPETDQFVLDTVKVQGGYIELYGLIINTGGGKIKVMDGYGKINIANNTSKEIVINGLDTGNVDGLIRMHSVVYGDQIITSVWERSNGHVYGTHSGEGLHYQEYFPNSRQGIHQPWGGIDRFVWTRGRDNTTTYVGGIDETSLFWGAIPLGELEYESWTMTSSGARDLPNGVYASDDFPYWTTNASYLFGKYTQQTDQLTHVGRQEWVTYEWWDFLHTTPTYHLRDTYEQGSKTIFTHSIKADYDIAIEFIGYDQGTLNVNSTGNIVLAGSLRNLGGTVDLGTSGSITQSADTVLITGKGVNLTAGTGIGDNSLPISVELVGSGSLSAATSSGNIDIYGIRGDMRLGAVSAANGTVRLDADRSILQASPGSSAVVTGNQVELISRAGSIGTSSQPLNLHVGQSDSSTFSATASDSIAINQFDGNLRLVRVKSWAAM